MNYALICLVGDENTQRIERSARAFAKRFPPQSDILSPQPSFDEVHRTVNEGNALLTGHNGSGNLRTTSQGVAWANASQFASMFQGSRVYVYACNTLGEGGLESLSSFGQEAVQQGVSCFAGHCVVVPTDNQSSQIDQVLHALWQAFLEGENDQESLQKVGWMAFRAGQRHRSSGKNLLSKAPLLNKALSAALHGLRVLSR
ncbi:MAG: hypothetical protein MUF64_15060 [Polyangiaceae bacterium]|jgi:hypothetical protein|nr:hypothetical protein [Polyangiaceae bacterium]